MRIVNKFILVLAICLTGCTSRWQVPKHGDFEQKSYKFECDGTKYTLYVSQNGREFVLFDSLLVPVVSRGLENGEFFNTKFLPPISKFDPIFIGILQMVEGKLYKARIKSGNLQCEVEEI